MLQLCMKDEYGQVTILDSNNDPSVLLAEARRRVNDENMQNALTIDEQRRDFTVVLPEFVKGKKITKDIYAGQDGNGRQVALSPVENAIPAWDEAPVGDVKGKLRFYIGTQVTDRKNDVKEEFFAQTPKGELIESFTDIGLENKSFYYIKYVR
jgi:hypothetical protein